MEIAPNGEVEFSTPPNQAASPFMTSSTPTEEISISLEPESEVSIELETTKQRELKKEESQITAETASSSSIVADSKSGYTTFGRRTLGQSQLVLISDATLHHLAQTKTHRVSYIINLYKLFYRLLTSFSGSVYSVVNLHSHHNNRFMVTDTNTRGGWSRKLYFVCLGSTSAVYCHWHLRSNNANEFLYSTMYVILFYC